MGIFGVHCLPQKLIKKLKYCGWQGWGGSLRPGLHLWPDSPVRAGSLLLTEQMCVYPLPQVTERARLAQEAGGQLLSELLPRGCE